MDWSVHQKHTHVLVLHYYQQLQCTLKILQNVIKCVTQLNKVLYMYIIIFSKTISKL
jgi:hypothetical protein